MVSKVCTYGNEVTIVPQRHISVQGSLSRAHVLPLITGELYSHIFKKC